MASKVIEIGTAAEYYQTINSAGEKLVVIDFSAKWCGPCHAIAPFVGELSFKYPEVLFLKVDVDDVREVAQAARVTAMPTFHFIKSGKKVEELVGASRERLESLVLKFLPGPEETLQQLVSAGQDMSDILTKSIRKVLDENPRATADVAFDTIEIYLSNVLKEPGNSKYRRIRIENEKFQERVWRVSGAARIMKYAGFQEGIEYGFLILPDKADLEALTILQLLISSRKDPGSSFYTPAPTPARGLPQPSRPAQQPQPQPQQPARNLSPEEANALAATLAATLANILPQQPPQAQPQASAKDPYLVIQERYLAFLKSTLKENDTTRGLFQQLKMHQRHVQFYERKDYHQKALSVIPVAQLKEKAKASLPEGGDEKAELMRHLLRWFKYDFFSWTDAPNCVVCQGKTKGFGAVSGSPEELRYGGSRVELYQCEACQAVTRFPRYNDPAKLLETRTGRCGEWANAFTLCCRALGYDARYVVDWTDHVWTEVFIESADRWIHCDPAEAAYDKPMIYEAGWGKKLSYVVAFSHEEVVDVTRRYTNKIQEVLQRRKGTPEKVLKFYIATLCVELRANMTSARLDELTRRFMNEQKELSRPNGVKQDELVGRVSGSLSWRQQRGELGSTDGFTTSSQSQPQPQPVPFTQEGKLAFDLQKASEGSLTFLGDATQTVQGALQITPGENDRVGGIFLRTPVKVQKGFTCEFSFVIKNAGADGFAFVLHNTPDTPLGKGGSELGYGGIKNSIAIEFDTFENVDRSDDPDGNHISIHTRGVEANEAHHSASLACTKRNIPPLNSGEKFFIRIIYRASSRELIVQLTEDPSKDYITVLSVELTLQKTIRLGGEGTAFLGFTGATGGLSQEQLVLSWRVFENE